MLKSSQFFQEPVKRMLRRDRMDLLVTGGQNHRPASSELLCPGSSHRNLITIMKRLQKPELQQSLPLLSPSLFLISPQHCTPPLTFWKDRVWTFSPGWPCTHGLSFTPSITGMDHHIQLKVRECGSQGSPYRVFPQGPSALFETVCHQDLGLADYISLGGQ